ncbi:WD repeat-containing 63-like, partial [Paramuricea clavata]
MSEETSNQNSGDGSGNLVAPQDILPLFFTSKTQQIFGCIADEDVNAENPHKVIPKETILQDFKDRAAVSDFHPAKKIVLDYPGEELLVVYDADFKYGQNFYLCTTEECKEKILHPELAAGDHETADGEQAEAAEEEIVVWKGPVTPRPWESLGSEIEVEDEKTVENRAKIKMCISRKRSEFGAPVKFADQSEKVMKDATVECLPFEDETYSLKKFELDIGIQAVQNRGENGSQTEWKKPRNACVQYEARFLPEEKKVEAEEAPSLLEFIQKVTPRFELALQQNEIMDVFYDDYVSLAIEDSTFGSKSDNYLKEYQSFTDLLYSKEKVITNTEWHPTAKGIIAVSCAELMSFDERVDNASRIIMTPSLILIWSFSDPIHPQLLLEAPDDIFSFKFNPSEPTIIAGGCVNGQVVLWDISSWNDRLLSHRQTSKAKKNTMTSLPGFEDDSNTDHTPVVRYCAVSSIEHSHKSAVSDLQWVPDHMETSFPSKTSFP